MRIRDHVHRSRTDIPGHGRVARGGVPPRRRDAFGSGPGARRAGGLAHPRRKAVGGHRDGRPSAAGGETRPDAAGGGAALRVLQPAARRRRPGRSRGGVPPGGAVRRTCGAPREGGRATGSDAARTDGPGGGGKGADGILARCGVALDGAGRPPGTFTLDADFRGKPPKDGVRWIDGLRRAGQPADA